MGEAKRRGNREQRIAQAVAREEAAKVAREAARALEREQRRKAIAALQPEERREVILATARPKLALAGMLGLMTSGLPHPAPILVLDQLEAKETTKREKG